MNSSEQQTLDPRLGDRFLISLLEQKVAGEPFPESHRSFIHEADAYSVGPAELVYGRAHAPGSDLGDGKGKRWLFCSPAKYLERISQQQQGQGGGSTRKRQRSVPGAGGGSWRTDAGVKSVKDVDGHSIVGYTRTLYFVTKKKNESLGAGAGAGGYQRLGWCMVELWPNRQQGADKQQLVLCKVYKSNRKYPAAAPRDGEIRAAAAAPRDGERASAAAVEPGDGEIRAAAAAVEPGDGEIRTSAAAELTVVMKFDGSSIASAERMMEVAKLVLSQEIRPVVVFSTMGNTTTNILMAAEKAVSCAAQNGCQIYDLTDIKDLHLRTIDELQLDRSIISGSLHELEQLLNSVAMTKELSPATRDRLVSSCERMSTTIFSAYLNKREKRARQYPAFDVGFIITDDFPNACILEANYPAVAKKLQDDWIDDRAIPIVTSFVGKGCSGAITTLGSDLTATIICRALGLGEIQIWKNVDGVFTGDPSICTNAMLVPYLTFDEATELAYSGAEVLHPQSMRLAMEAGGISVRVKNSYNPQGLGTRITQTRDMSKSILTSIAWKSNIPMLDVASTIMAGQCDLQAKVFSISKNTSIPVDCEATRGDNISLTLYPSKPCSCELIKHEIDNVVEELGRIAVVHRHHKSIISLIGNAHKSSFVLAKAFTALAGIGVNAQKVSQNLSKNQVLNVSLVVDDSEAKRCLQALHSAFFEDGFLSRVEGEEKEHPVPVASSFTASASSGVVRKADDHDHPEAPTAARRGRMTDIGPSSAGADGYPLPVGVDSIVGEPVGAVAELEEGDGSDWMAGILYEQPEGMDMLYGGGWNPTDYGMLSDAQPLSGYYGLETFESNMGVHRDASQIP